MPTLLIMILAFYNVDDVRKCIDSILIATRDLTVDIVVLENPSPKSQDMKKMLKNYPKIEHFIANKNLGGQLFLGFVNQKHKELQRYDYISLTEGDVILEPLSVNESITLLEKYKNTLKLCSIDIALHNHPKAAIWVPKAKTAGDHLIGPTGFQFITFDRQFLFNFCDCLNSGQLKNSIALGDKNFTGLSDTNLIRYTQKTKTTWIRTKNSQLLHIGWDHYKNSKDEYWQYKTKMLKTRQIRSKKCVNQLTDLKFTKVSDNESC